ncbi:MAG TPA: glycerophosphodiester phosphodiesterase family protein [Roseiarcus sp.]|nr:glycerophosphodiester phosphodiesterase family protein [Roseiarcus sp.]
MSLDWLAARPIAHRGWHGAGRPENSLAAAEAASAAGYAVECDIQRTADGEAVVFHDDTLARLTGAKGRIGDFTLAALGALRLAGSDEPIPTLGELIKLIAGRVGLVCEVKSGFDGDTRLAARAAEIAAAYDGPLAFKSFDPEVVAFLRAGACPRPLGIVAEADYDDPYFAALTTAQKRDWAAFLHIRRTAPDFLSWNVDDLPHATPTLMRALGRKPVIAWTVRRPAQWAAAKLYADQAVFEGEVA